jgi:hypothetical protein
VNVGNVRSEGVQNPLDGLDVSGVSFFIEAGNPFDIMTFNMIRTRRTRMMLPVYKNAAVSASAQFGEQQIKILFDPSTSV